MTKDPTTLGKGDKKPLSDPITPAIPDYELIRVIGKGSFGEVWVALDATGTPCALKIIYKGLVKVGAPKVGLQYLLYSLQQKELYEGKGNINLINEYYKYDVLEQQTKKR